MELPDGNRVEVTGTGGLGVGGNIDRSVVFINVANPASTASQPTVLIPAATTLPAFVEWPNYATHYEPDIANRDAEFGFFCAMINGRTTERAIFLEAPTNCGKTTLVNECRRYTSTALSPVAAIKVDFKATPSKEDTLDTLRLDLQSLFPQFSQSTISTGELRANLRILRQPIVLFFDSYEKASPATCEFLMTLVLGDLEKLPAVRVVIAGQRVPDHATAMWTNSVRHFLLGPINEVKHRERVTNKHFPNLTREQIHTVLDTILRRWHLLL